MALSATAAGGACVMGRRSTVPAFAVALILLAAGSASAGCVVGPIAEMPVTMAGTRPLIQAKINGADATFLADSGAFFSIISTAGALQYGLELHAAPYGFRVRGVGGQADVKTTTIKTFTLAGADLQNIEFLVGGSEAGSGAVGVIGQNILHIEDVEFDLAGGMIRLMKSQDCGGANLAYWSAGKPYSIIGIDETTPLQPHTISSAYVNGVRIRVMFDTGASRSFLGRAAAARAGIRVDGPGVTYEGPSSGIGRRTVDSWIVPVASFKIGDEEIRNTRLLIGDSDLGDADMLLGADFFLSHRIYVAKHLRKLFFTFNGGPVFNLESRPPPAAAATASTATASPPPAAAGSVSADTPADADGYSRRGEARAARGDRDGALADLDRACALAPGEARYAYQRAMLHAAEGDITPALADLDRTLKLQPKHLRALIARASLNRGRGETAAALADLDAADHAAAKEADERLRLATEYERLDRLSSAAAQFDAWIAAHGDDSRLPQALTGRCWVEALRGEVLAKAAADCEAARRSLLVTARVFEGRGLIRLRRGDLAGAVADFNTALERQPKAVWALYGRGLAEQRQGRKPAGDLDMVAAIAIQPDLPILAKRYGVLAEDAKPSAAPAPAATTH